MVIIKYVRHSSNVIKHLFHVYVPFFSISFIRLSFVLYPSMMLYLQLNLSFTQTFQMAHDVSNPIYKLSTQRDS